MKKVEINAIIEMGEYHRTQGNFSAAANCFGKIIEISPKNTSALNCLGMTYHQMGQTSKAIDFMEKAIKYDDRQPEYYTNLGKVFQTAGKPKEAENAYRKALTINRDFVAALINMGVILLEREQTKSAITALDRALLLAPENADAILALADAKKASGQVLEALELYIDATKTLPLREVTWLRLANINTDLDQWDAAHINLKRSLILAPQHCETWSNLGFTCINYGDFQRAQKYFYRSLLIRSNFAPAYGGLGEVHYLQNHVDDALICSEIAIQLSPDDPYHYQNRRSMQLLAKGRVKDGWSLRDARLKLADRIDHRGRPPRWDGSPLDGKTLLITAEEGIGDELFFASCFKDAIAASGKCFIECDPRLVSLFSRSFPEAIIGESERVGNRFKPVQSYNWLPQRPPVDASIEAGSLFKFFRTSIKEYTNTGPYLIPSPKLKQSWKDRLEGLGAGLKVGFCWRSKYQSDFRNHHYTAIADWTSLFSLDNCQFVSLQYGTKWQEEIDALPTPIREKIIVFDDTDVSNDMEAVFSIAANLDLIISPSSTVSWIGGSLTVPTWVLHLRPNHTQLGTPFFPGFPSMKSFPKNISEPWSACFEPILRELKRLK
ncbi:MAG: hypothetical protein CMM58_08885 [Rhodospirillaceae bacterium]|nr:hypothetical protein [Rhodospirillaceae bacterium]|tara:strand:+ start:175 stop:1992 length:1818 start_codon:yes stop_codon:yes gene_type:complete